jgi:hypothetical protein
MVQEHWVEARIKFRTPQLDNLQYQRLLLSVIKPTIQELEESHELVSFHFLFEPQHELFRIRLSTPSSIERVKQLVREQLEQVKDLVVTEDPKLYGEYSGEAGHFGEDGWQLAQKMFEMGTRLAIAMADPEFSKEIGFQPGKIVHCMMNPNFGSMEYKFYLEQFVGRIMAINRKTVVDEELETKIKNLLDSKLKEWKNAQLRII